MAADDPRTARILMEQRLLAELEAARDRYEAAKAEARRVTEVYGDLGPGHVDGSYALRQAVAAETASLRRYQKALMEFTDLVVKGKLPPESAPA